jgi:hypothetical protein
MRNVLLAFMTIFAVAACDDTGTKPPLVVPDMAMKPTATPDLSLKMLGCRGHLMCLQNAMTAADQANCDALETAHGMDLDTAWNDCLTTACLSTKDIDFGAPDCNNKDFSNCTKDSDCNTSGCNCDANGQNCSACTCSSGLCTTRDVCGNCISTASASGGACAAQAMACLNDR